MESTRETLPIFQGSRPAFIIHIYFVCYVMLCYVMLCYVICYVICYVMLCYVICYVMLCHTAHEVFAMVFE